MPYKLIAKKNPAEVEAETHYLDFFWKGYFEQESHSMYFYTLTESARNELKKLIKNVSAKELNRYLNHPQITQYLLESICENVIAFPSKIETAISHKLGRDFPAEDEIIKKLPANMIFEHGQILVKNALESIDENEKGISLLSGYELVRMPFQDFRFKKLYSVDMCYLDKIRLMGQGKFRARLWQIFKESTSKPEGYRNICEVMCKTYKTSSRGYLKSGLMLGNVKKGESLLDWVIRRVPKKRAEEIKSGKFVPLLGNAENLDKLQQINVKNFKTKPTHIPKAGLDFALMCGIEWFSGDWKKGLREAEKLLKKNSRIIVSGYYQEFLMMPPEGVWGAQLKDWFVAETIEPEEVVAFLKELGFKVDLKTIPDNYWCAVGTR